MRFQTTAYALGMAALMGCLPSQSVTRRDADPDRVGTGGMLVSPKRCAVTMAIVSRPVKDPAIDSVWRAADEQVVDPEVRRALEANGLRIGLVTGDPPPEIEALLNAPPPHKVEPMTLVLPDGDNSLVKLGNPSSKPISLLLNVKGKAMGKVYQAPQGNLRIAASHDGATGVAVRIVPELHHGAFQHRISADPGAGAFATQQFMFKDGQEEETFRDLAATLTLQSRQFAVIGCRPNLGLSLGDFLLTEPEVGSDRLLQKVIFLWAGRSHAEAPGAKPGAPPPALAPAKSE